MEQRVRTAENGHVRRRQPSVHHPGSGADYPERLRTESRDGPGALTRRFCATVVASGAHLRGSAVVPRHKGEIVSDDPIALPDIDLPLLRGLTERRLSRGQMLRIMGAGAGSLSLASFLAACGTAGTNSATGN